MVVKACDECKVLNTKQKLYSITEGGSSNVTHVAYAGHADPGRETKPIILSVTQVGFKVVEDKYGAFEASRPFKTLCRSCLNTEIERLLDAKGE